MKIPRSKLQVCRWVNADLWGTVLNSRKLILNLFKAIYNPYERRPVNFVVRINKVAPKARRRVYTKYSLAIWERRKLSVYYGLSLLELRRRALRAQNIQGSYNRNFVASLESMLHVILWRVGYFSTPEHAKKYIKSSGCYINKILTHFISKRIVPGDCVTLPRIDQRILFNSIRRRIYHIRNYHFLINFRLPSIFYIEFPDPLKLFFYFKMSHLNVFNTTKFRRR